MYLYLNTTQRDSFSVALIVADKIIKKKLVHSERKHSEKLLKTIDGILKSVKKSIHDLSGIAVVKGPGSFTSLRIGVSTANALAFGLGIQVIGVDKDEALSRISVLFNKKHNNRKISIVLPEYGQEPNITIRT